MSNGWMKKDSGQEEKISGITQVLLDTTKIRTLKVLSNRSKKWWLFMSHYCARSSFYSSNVMEWIKLAIW